MWCSGGSSTNRPRRPAAERLLHRRHESSTTSRSIRQETTPCQRSPTPAKLERAMSPRGVRSVDTRAEEPQSERPGRIASPQRSYSRLCGRGSPIASLSAERIRSPPTVLDCALRKQVLETSRAPYVQMPTGVPQHVDASISEPGGCRSVPMRGSRSADRIKWPSHERPLGAFSHIRVLRSLKGINT
jgi:hypothetical protein